MSFQNRKNICMGAMILLSALISTVLISTVSNADVPKIVAAKAIHQGDNVYDFEVTVKHADEGWSHWVDRWDVLTPHNKLIKWRVLLHPHVKEQPFTRYLRNVEVPKGLTHVYIRANDTVHKLGPSVKVSLPR